MYSENPDIKISRDVPRTAMNIANEARYIRVLIFYYGWIFITPPPYRANRKTQTPKNGIYRPDGKKPRGVILVSDR